MFLSFDASRSYGGRGFSLKQSGIFRRDFGVVIKIVGIIGVAKDLLDFSFILSTLSLLWMWIVIIVITVI